MSGNGAPRIGVDVGGTKVLGVLLSGGDDATVVDRRREPTPRGGEELLDVIAGVAADLDPTGAARLGVGLPGLVGHDGRFAFGANLPGVLGLDAASALGERTGRRVAVDNDATCATRAEFALGAGRGHRDGILLTLGTGIGAGLVLDGEVRTGSRGYAGEPGHMVVDPDGPECPCGRRGCWERYASGSGLGYLARVAATEGRLAAAVAEVGGVDALRGEHVVAAAASGDHDAAQVLDRFAWWIALGIANLIDLLDPGVVVLGGGAMTDGAQFLDRIVAAVPGQVLGVGHRPLPDLVAATLGPEAGAIGAALLDR